MIFVKFTNATRKRHTVQLAHGLLGILCLALLAACGAPTDLATQADAQSAAGPTSVTASSSAPLPGGLIASALPSVAPLTPNAEQQQAMQDPQQLVQFWAEQIKQARYTEIEPLLTDSLRQAFRVRAPGSVEAFYRQQAEQAGGLTGYSVLGRRTPYDTDRVVAVDVDLTYAQQASKDTLDLVQSENGWKIDNFGPRPNGSLPDIKLSDAQRQILQDPQQVVRAYADALKSGQYDGLAPLFTFYARTNSGASGDFAAQAREDERRVGKLRDYAIRDTRTAPDNFVEVDIDLVYEQATLRTMIVLQKTEQGWKINHSVPRQ